MSTKNELERIVSTKIDPRLAMFVVSSHVDKPLEEGEPQSIYNIPIQAGAALTEKRICELNDFDNAEETISDRNQRYSEMTAMFWAGKNIVTEYVGISHYRRRFLLSDRELSDRMDRGFDIITTRSYPLPEIISQNYLVSYYGYDWRLFLSILEKRNPEYLEKAEEEFSKDHIHPCNMNIFSREMYEEYCEFVFPILDEYYQKSPWKLDIYQRRDAGFVGERLSSLFVEKKKADGFRVTEAPFRDLRSKGWTPEDECDLGDYDAVYAACRNYFAQCNITRCRNLVAGAMNKGGFADQRIRDLAHLFHTAIQEQRELPETMLEYLPQQWKKDLDTLREVYVSFGNMIKVISQNPAPEAVDLYRQFLGMTGFSEIAIRCQCKTLGIKDKDAILKLGTGNR